ncbi:MAG: hypothetical protein R2713_12040 [Ilumatobacteraceae bacterium]
MRLIAGPDGIDAGCAPVRIDAPSVDVRGLRGLRVAMVTGDGGWAPAASTRDAVTRAVDLLVGFGATLVDDALPSHLDESLDITQRYWRRAAHDPALTGRRRRSAVARLGPLRLTARGPRQPWTS